jgi:hypothetical protein
MPIGWQSLWACRPAALGSAPTCVPWGFGSGTWVGGSSFRGFGPQLWGTPFGNDHPVPVPPQVGVAASITSSALSSRHNVEAPTLSCRAAAPSDMPESRSERARWRPTQARGRPMWIPPRRACSRPQVWCRRRAAPSPGSRLTRGWDTGDLEGPPSTSSQGSRGPLVSRHAVLQDLRRAECGSAPPVTRLSTAADGRDLDPHIPLVGDPPRVEIGRIQVQGGSFQGGLGARRAR